MKMITNLHPIFTICFISIARLHSNLIFVHSFFSHQIYLIRFVLGVRQRAEQYIFFTSFHLFSFEIIITATIKYSIYVRS